jgi:hypothetical protein
MSATDIFCHLRRCLALTRPKQKEISNVETALHRDTRALLFVGARGRRTLDGRAALRQPRRKLSERILPFGLFLHPVEQGFPAGHTAAARRVVSFGMVRLGLGLRAAQQGLNVMDKSADLMLTVEAAIEAMAAEAAADRAERDAAEPRATVSLALIRDPTAEDLVALFERITGRRATLDERREVEAVLTTPRCGPSSGGRGP